jgi:hypothetical protein
LKNQYFGDVRDLFKYDLALECLEAGMLHQFTLIPMLTPNESTPHGQRTNYKLAKAGKARVKLIRFLNHRIKKNMRSVFLLREFFSQHYPNTIFNIHQPEPFFTQASRENYFESISDEILVDAVILIDPDVGLAGSTGKTDDKHLRYKEAAAIYNKMGANSILIVFQFIPRVKRNEFYLKIGRKLKTEVTLERPVFYVSDNTVVFFIIAKTKFSETNELLTKYAKRYNLVVGKV